MAMVGGPRCGRRVTGPPSGKAILLIELKNRMLLVLHKLSDRDTQQLAVEELERIAQNLTPEGIALFLSCVYDTDAQQKSIVRRECIRLVGTLATLYGDLMACHLPKIVGNIIRRLKDPDSSIRDACVESIGTLASQIGGVHAGSSINVFVKPLLEALAEQHKTLQTGAAMCLARVIECTRDPHAPTLQRLCPRVVKMLASPNFLAKASLLNAVGVMVQVPGVISASQLLVLLGSVQKELNSTEWAVRKGAAETLSCMCTAASGTLGSYRGSVLSTLESSRFDKVKPVRDSINEALQLWKSVYDPNAPPSVTPSVSHESASPKHFFEGDASSPTADRRSSLRGSVNSSFSNASGTSKSMPKSSANTLKRTPALSDKKPNSNFFRKLEGVRDSIEWQIDVACPLESPREESPRVGAAISEHLVYHRNCTEAILESDTRGTAYGEGLAPEESNCRNGNYNQEVGGEINQPAKIEEIVENGYEDPNTTILQDALENHERWRDSQGNEHENGEYSSPWDANVPSISNDDKATADMETFHRQFQSLERQQLSMMEMLQESMVCVHESMQDLEGRVSKLEQIVEDMAHNSGNREGRSPIGESHRYQGGHPLGKYLSDNGFLNFKGEKVNEDTSLPLSARTQDSLEKMTESTSGDLEEFALASGHQMPVAEILRRPNVWGLNSLQKGNRANAKFDQDMLGTRRACDRGTSLLLQGEGPSTRSVWHASKEEAIAAIRGAAVLSKPHSHQKHSGRDFNSDKKPTRVAGGPFWMLWSQAMESVRVGEMDVAYVEILGSSDELLLVRLMGRTGPVLEQLSVATVTQLMCCIKQFLQQQSFMDCIIPWLQQVSDLISSCGSDKLGLTVDTKKDLVFALQEATSVEYGQSWMGAKIAVLAEHLGNVWSSYASSTMNS